jgi:hypothetical protein
MTASCITDNEDKVATRLELGREAQANPVHKLFERRLPVTRH